jgi:hypothetical protein
MARSEARLQFGMWRTGLDGRSAHAKLVYAVLLTEPTLSQCGVGAVRLSRWARDASLTTAETEKALSELAGDDPLTAQVLIDDDTEEVLVRTLVRRDGIAEQPYVLKGALKEALMVASPLLRRVLASELRKLPPRQPDGVSKAGKPVIYPDPHATADLLDPPPAPLRTSRKGSETLSDGVENPSETLRGSGGGSGGGISSDVGGEVQEPLSSAEPPRADVERLCQHFADRVEQNLNKRWPITERWRTSARLLLDKDLADERDPLGLALRVVDWAADDEFWSTNLEALPKFRQQFPKLRAKARKQWEQTRRPARQYPPSAAEGWQAMKQTGTDGGQVMPFRRALPGGESS